MKVTILKEGSRPDEIGYHFTDIEGFMKIIHSNVMKATNGALGARATREIYVPDKKGDYVEASRGEYRRIKAGENPSEESRYKLLKGNHLEALRNKKSWSYTRKKQGMNYRNFQTFEDNTVCIVIDIDKISERQKIVPFTWNTKSHQKSGHNFEYEERVIGDTENFDKYIKKVYFKQELDLLGYNEEEEDSDYAVSDYPIAYIDSLDDFVDAMENESTCLQIMKYRPKYSGYDIFKSVRKESIYDEFNLKKLLYDEEGNTNKNLIKAVQDKVRIMTSFFNNIDNMKLKELEPITEKDITIDDAINRLRKSKVELIFLDKERKSPITFDKAVQNYIQKYNKNVSRINSTFKKFNVFFKSDNVYNFIRNQLKISSSLINQAEKDLDSLKSSTIKKVYENFMKNYDKEYKRFKRESGLSGIKEVSVYKRYNSLIFRKNDDGGSIFEYDRGYKVSQEEFDEVMEEVFEDSIKLKGKSILEMEDLDNFIEKKLQEYLKKNKKRFRLRFLVYDDESEDDSEHFDCEINFSYDYDSKLGIDLPGFQCSVFKRKSN